MNIQQYYKQSATASLNASLVAFIPPTLILIYSVVLTHKYELFLLLIPFLIYSFYCYQLFIINQNRSKAVSLASFTTPISDLLKENELLITLLPAPTLRLLLFSSDGYKVGEIRDQSFLRIRWFLPYFADRLFTKKFELYDQYDSSIAVYHQHRDRVEIITPDGNIAATILMSQYGKKKEFFLENKSVSIEKKGFPADYLFVTSEDQLVAQIQTGWMPVEWGKRFVNPNTPILKMDKKATKMDKLQLFAMLISIYAYMDH